MEAKLHRHVTELNDSNGGEALVLETIFEGEVGEEQPWMNQSLTLQSYGNSATISFYGYLTPEKLRNLADELEEANRIATEKLQQLNKTTGV